MAQLHLTISGMTCGHCVAAVERALDGVPGVAGRKVSIGAAEVEYDPARTGPQRITAAVREMGYPAESAG